MRQLAPQRRILRAVVAPQRRRQLRRQLPVPTRPARAPRQRPQTRFQLGLHRAGAIQMIRRPRPLPPRVLHPPPEPAHVGHLFDQPPPLAGPHPQHLVHSALPDHRVAVRAQSRRSEQLLHLAQPHRAPVDPELRLAIPVHSPHDLNLCGVQVQPASAVIQRQPHLGQPRRRTAPPAAEDHVVDPPHPQVAVRRLPDHPAQRVHHVRLARAVGADDRRHRRGEAQLGARPE